jgi:eukaryotic-like serine/threonine-protein kinase
MRCLDENELVAFADGSIADNARSQAAEHLRGCEACRTVLATVYDASGRQRTSASRARSRAALLPDSAAAPRFEPLVTIGRYVVRSICGEGGMGVVYRAYDSQLDRHVALKFLRASQGHESTQRLSREAQALARVAHPTSSPSST